MEILGICCMLPFMPLVILGGIALCGISIANLFGAGDYSESYSEEIEFDGKFRRKITHDRDHLPRLEEKDIWTKE